MKLVLLTIDETAERLRIGRASVYRKIHRGDIPAVRLGGGRTALRVRVDELEKWLDTQHVNGGAY